MVKIVLDKSGLTPLGVVIRLVLVIIVAEVLIELGMNAVITSVPGSKASDLMWVAFAVMALLAGELKKCAVQVQIDLPPDLPPIQCSAGSLQQVLVNVLLNARDAIAGQPQPRITVSGRLDSDQVTLSVCDNGPRHSG